MDGDGRSRPREHTQPNAQPIGAIGNDTNSPGVAVKLLPALSQPTPTKPITLPSHSPRLAYCPRNAPGKTIDNGTDATAVAGRPDDTLRSASTAMPLPSSNNPTPINATFFDCARVGAATPHQRRTAYNTVPAKMRRAPNTIVSGCTPPSSAKRIAR
ncbi:hypothetical protein PD5205_00273 [Xanthomonas fragariae]|uniref:Uncharacterized protein n=1 Tax=Xanthomonas fragariae TaxID=48664 RepID=A0A1Y6HJJ1_9XANT|nr:hypothetical protein O1K_11850 [Xanthomonas fragariae LMG 25863]SMR01593.1 hypothetical protein PD5205_00273 [Xanthomonas fragariae]